MEIALVVIFLVAYALIALEHPLKIDKSATALLAAGALWLVVVLSGAVGTHVHEVLSEHLSPIAEIVIFLMGAMTIVQVIDRHRGFAIITERIKTEHLRSLLVIIGFTTFGLSSMLDNLATTIVMVAVMLKFVREGRDRVVFTGIVVIASNAGGAFSPIGDITTTMLWIGGQISPGEVILRLFLPSLTAFVVPLLLALPLVKGKILAEIPGPAEESKPGIARRESVVVLIAGVGSLVAIPFIKLLTGLPPFMGILAALGVIWLLTEILRHRRPANTERHLTVSKALSEIDMTSILFFVGILLSVAALETGGVLHRLSEWMEHNIPDRSVVALGLGTISAVFDNVPLVAASMELYPLSKVPMDDGFWHLLAYAAGTGGSMLIIGSAAGVTAMGSTRVSFGQYAITVAPLALAGYAAGAGVYFLQVLITGS